MTPRDFTLKDFEALMQPVPKIPPLGDHMTFEGYERLVMRLENRIKELDAKLGKARFEALEEAAKIVESAPIGALPRGHYTFVELALEIRALKDGSAAAARSEALEDAAKISDHHAEVHDTAVRCYESLVHRGDNDRRLAWGHAEASQCAAKIAADIRALKDGKAAAALE